MSQLPTKKATTPDVAHENAAPAQGEYRAAITGGAGGTRTPDTRFRRPTPNQTSQHPGRDTASGRATRTAVEHHTTPQEASQLPTLLPTGPATAQSIPDQARTQPAALDELASFNQWVRWRRLDDGRKIPQQVGGDAASSTNPATWGSYTAVATNAPGGRVGFVLTASDAYAVLDLDDCIDDAGTLDPAAAALVQRFGSYTEITPSGRGLRIWLQGVLPGAITSTRYPDAGFTVEAYDRKRYLTWTGQHLAGTPTTINAAQPQLNTLYQLLRPGVPTHVPQPPPEPRRQSPRMDPSSSRLQTQRAAYLDKIQDKRLREASSAGNGTRNTTLNNAAFMLGRLVGHGWLDEGATIAALLGAAGVAGLSYREAIGTIRSGLRNGIATYTEHRVPPWWNGTDEPEPAPPALPRYPKRKAGRPARYTAAALLDHYRRQADAGTLVGIRRAAAAALGCGTATLDRLDRQLASQGEIRISRTPDRQGRVVEVLSYLPAADTNTTAPLASAANADAGQQDAPKQPADEVLSKLPCLSSHCGGTQSAPTSPRPALLDLVREALDAGATTRKRCLWYVQTNGCGDADEAQVEQLRQQERQRRRQHVERQQWQAERAHVAALDDKALKHAVNGAAANVGRALDGKSTRLGYWRAIHAIRLDEYDRRGLGAEPFHRQLDAWRQEQAAPAGRQRCPMAEAAPATSEAPRDAPQWLDSSPPAACPSLPAEPPAAPLRVVATCALKHRQARQQQPPAAASAPAVQTPPA